MAPTKVAELTVEEFKTLIKEVVRQTLYETLEDSDEGLDLRPEMQEQIQQSLEYTESGGATSTVDDVAARLGLDW